ncbi:TolC family protein [Novosphingobium sp. PhB165]|uniref:TolC family protein n=1 Tax=Novosphingobium sp. PhB165 TaxID=2485105 RepID=UPI0014047D07|nr:TolC family protein [Novosphingobium sp. PhB165]
MRIFGAWNRAGAPMVMAIACALAAGGLSGCAGQSGPAAQVPKAPEPTVEAPTDGDWWKTASDPLLADLIARGIAADTDLACRAARLDAQNEEDAAAARRLTGKVRKLVGGEQDLVRDATRRADAYAYAQARAERAAAVALAYVEVRRLQKVLVLRTERLDQFRDNAAIAEFRRQAGLVTGIDGGIGSSMAGVADADLSATRARFDAARANLARMTGMEDAALLAALGEAGDVPDLGRDPPGVADEGPLHRADLQARRYRLLASIEREKMSQADIDAAEAHRGDPGTPPLLRDGLAEMDKAELAARAEIAATRQSLVTLDTREAALAQSSERARRAVQDARSAYRAGMGDFATLYVAEASALSVEEARLGIRAERASAMIRLHLQRGDGWSATDLTPPPGGAGCD